MGEERVNDEGNFQIWKGMTRNEWDYWVVGFSQKAVKRAIPRQRREASMVNILGDVGTEKGGKGFFFK